MDAYNDIAKVYARNNAKLQDEESFLNKVEANWLSFL